MSRLIHSADWHLGAPNQPDCFGHASAKLLVDACLEKSVFTLLIAGDVFDKHNPSQQDKDKLLQLILDNPKINFVFTVGNHDYLDKARSYHTLVYLDLLSKHFSNLYVLDEGLHEVCGVTFLVLSDDLFTWGTIKAPGAVAVWHGTVPGVILGDPVEGKQAVQKLLSRSEVSYVALGDIHKQRSVFHDRCWYCGSLYPKTYSCEDGFIYFDGEKPISCKLDQPKRITQQVDFAKEEIGELTKELKKIPQGNLLRLKTNLPQATLAECRNELVGLLEDHFLEVKIDNTPAIDTQRREEASKANKDIDVVKALAKKYAEDANPKTVHKLCMRYLTEASVETID